MLRALVVITIGLLLSGCALDAMGRGSPSGSSPPPKATKVIKQAPVVPVPFGETKPAPAKKVAEKKEKKKRSWLFW